MLRFSRGDLDNLGHDSWTDACRPVSGGRLMSFIAPSCRCAVAARRRVPGCHRTVGVPQAGALRKRAMLNIGGRRSDACFFDAAGDFGSDDQCDGTGIAISNARRSRCRDTDRVGHHRRVSRSRLDLVVETAPSTTSPSGRVRNRRAAARRPRSMTQSIASSALIAGPPTGYNTALER